LAVGAEDATLADVDRASKQIDETIAQQRQATVKAETTLAAATERLVQLVEQRDEADTAATPQGTDAAFATRDGTEVPSPGRCQASRRSALDMRLRRVFSAAS